MGWRLRLLCEWIFWHVNVPVLRLVAPLFFDRRYLQGRHFTARGPGWRWVQRSILTQRILTYNRHLAFPVSPFIIISHGPSLVFDVEDLQILQSHGIYLQNFAASITLGRGTYIAPNVGILTANHDPDDLDVHQPGQPVVLGERCWVGMNAVILPGVTLGPRTIVGAGAVVTKSFPDGHVTLVGVPARPLAR